VTAIPTSGGTTLVQELAAAVAAELGLPYVPCLTTGGDSPPQRSMQNSVLKLANARAALGVDGSRVRPGPVLLIDDIVDSRWTMTVAGSLLREQGSGPVFPFALAAAGAGDD
jgi:ATP-dependent DNA helicase RecQ